MEIFLYRIVIIFSNIIIVAYIVDTGKERLPGFRFFRCMLGYCSNSDMLENDIHGMMQADTV